MRLRLKVLLSLVGTVMLLVAALHTLVDRTLLPRFERMEHEAAVTQVRQAQAALGQRSQQIGVKVADWARWDDARDFLLGKMPDFPQRNVHANTLAEMRLSTLIYVDRTGRLALDAALDGDGNLKHAPRELAALLRPGGALSAGPAQRQGLILLPDGLLMFAIAPVTSTDGGDEPVGACLFGRFVDDAERAELARAIGQPIRIEPAPLRSEHAELFAELTGRSEPLVVPIDYDHLDAHAALCDVFGRPVAMLSMTLPRSIVLEGTAAIDILSRQSLYAAALLGAMTFLLFEKLVLSRVTRFSEQLTQIANTQDLTRRVNLAGGDEVAQLARPVNRLLESLSRLHGQLQDEQQLLETSEQRLNLALEAAGDGLWDWDMRTGRLYVSSTWARMMGFLDQDVPQSKDEMLALVHPEDVAHARAMRDRHLAGESADIYAELRMRTSTGTWKWILARGRVVKWDASGRPIRMIGTHQDIDERRHAEAALRESREQLAVKSHEAEQASRTKSDFLANMSHEIRTPMSAIIGYVDLLLDESLSPTRRADCVQTIRRNGDHLLALINDILDLSKVEAGKMTLERIDCDPLQVTSDVEKLMRVRAAEKHLAFSVEAEGLLPRVIRTDPTRLRQVLLNLVSNAIKFTHSGGVAVRLKMVHVQGKPTHLRFVVSDTGIGMDASQQLRLFKPFSQADESTTRKFGGTGLGLAITKRLVELLGGTVQCASEPGKGTQVGITIETGEVELIEPRPLSESSADKPVVCGASPLQGLRVLLAEDGPDNQRLIGFYLTRSGATAELAGNGQIAVERVRAAEARGEPFDLVLMDMQMPVLDGYAATRQLRAMGLRLPVIALTAHAMTGDREKCLDAGCTDYLTKPIDAQLLIERITAHAPVARRREPLVSELGSDDPGLRELVQGYVSELPEQASQLVRLLNERNFDDLRRLVHQIKGAGGGYGFPTISHAAEEAERAMKLNEDLQSVRAKVDTLIEQIRCVEGYSRKAEVRDAAACTAD